MPTFNKILILLTLCFLISYVNLAESQEKSADNTADMVIADFESLPNNLGGELFMWADLEPDWENLKGIYSWIYELSTPGFDTQNLHSGIKSLRLVNGLGKYQDLGWGMAVITLGKIEGLKPGLKIKPLDASGFNYLVIWVKPVQADEGLRVLLRDVDCKDFKGKVVYSSQNLDKEIWQRIAIDLNSVKKNINLTKLVSVNISFSDEEKNQKGNVMYLDDIALVK